ncbi:hypothetical protein EG329_010617 [Mollisiaceae sp. DMI_Dod_QoI]|nr:hypothetical protein EG329_010617 [Helotiales sp. DMI_Dod_QoI]
MAMDEERDAQSIYDASLVCSTLFERYLDSSATPLNDDFAVELRGRFNLWAAYVGAFATPKASLDARLLAHRDIRDMIMELLVMIQANMSYALKPSYNDKIVKPEAELVVSEKPSALLGLNAVETALGRLHSIAIAIRRSAARSHQQKLSSDALGKDDGLCYLTFVKRRFPNARDSLVDQVATSIHFRGRSMFYQQRHNRKIAAKRGQKEIDLLPNIEAPSEIGQPEIATTFSEPTSSNPLMSETNVSVIDRQDLLNRIRNVKPSNSIISRGSSVREGQDERFDYPRVPSTKQNSSGALCPLCSEPLESSSLTLKGWRDHVDRDIEPYVCISEECKEPLQFFAHFRDWKEHMQRMHTLNWAQIIHTTTWYCDSNHPCEYFDRKDSFMQHLSAKHTLTRAQLLARTRRNKAVTTRESFACPLCDCLPDEVASRITEKPYEMLSSHIAQHLKALAFLSLSYLDYEEEISNESVERDGAEFSEASRHEPNDDSFDDVPSTEVLKSGEKRVDGHTFLEPPELDEPVTWHSLPCKTYPERDKTLESFTMAMANKSSFNDYESIFPSTLSDRILDKYVESKFDADIKLFLPAGCIDELVTLEAIIKELGEKDQLEYGHLQLPERHLAMNLVEFVLRKSKKVFAITILSGLRGTVLRRAMQRFMEIDFTDYSLPLIGRDLEDAPVFHHANFSPWTQVRIDYFRREQWRFLAPVFSPQNTMFHLEPEHILPFIQRDDQVKEGAFSQVFQAEIHPAHLKDSVMKVGSSPTKIAIKELMIPSNDDELQQRLEGIWTSTIHMWRSTAQSWDNISSLTHPNLNRCIGIITRGRQRYLMFPWADGGNLRDFWIEHPTPKVSAEHVKDIVRQLQGMAEALNELHSSGFRHEDIKPENILYFPARDSSRVGMFKISSLSANFEHNVLGTATYQAPESIIANESSPRTRLSDVWSMGCVILELMFWLLYGYEALVEFNTRIRGKAGKPSSFFEIREVEAEEQQGTHPRLVADIHPAVQACLDGISTDPECEGKTALADLLHIVKTQLLVVELPEHLGKASNISRLNTGPEKHRTNASGFVSALDDILQGKNATNESYWFTGRSRDNLRLPRVAPKIDTEGNVIHFSMGLAPKSGLVDDQLKVPPSIDVPTSRGALPGPIANLSDEWSYPVDNDFASRLLKDMGTSVAPTDGLGSTRLCGKCEKMNFWDQNFGIEDTWSYLERNLDTCDFCQMRWGVSKHLDRKEYPSVSFERVESTLRMKKNKSPVFSICGSPEEGLNRTLPASIQIGFPQLPKAGSKAYFQILRQWLKNCDDNHEIFKCQSYNTTFLPTRLIDVGRGETPTIRLYETQATDSFKYLVLSHSAIVSFFHSTPYNVEDYKKKINFSDLPLTFRHAVITTRELGHQYIWIEEFCIIHGLDSDFKQEAERMEDIFSSAYCVLAASSAELDNDGFIDERKDRQFVAYNYRRDQIPFYVCHFIDDFTKHALGSPLTQRIIFYEDLYKRYTRLVYHNLEDRLMGIAGLEKRLATSLKMHGGFGIFDDGKSLLKRSLLWQRSHDEPTMQKIKHSFDITMPTWSWMAYKGGIDYLELPSDGIDWQDDLRSPWPWIPYATHLYHTVYNSKSIELKALARDFSDQAFTNEVMIVYDSPEALTDNWLLRCIVMGKRKEEGRPEDARHYVLIIEPTEDALIYERVGVGFMPRKFIEWAPEGARWISIR